jgi:hypothetical protein
LRAPSASVERPKQPSSALAASGPTTPPASTPIAPGPSHLTLKGAAAGSNEAQAEGDNCELVRSTWEPTLERDPSLAGGSMLRDHCEGYRHRQSRCSYSYSSKRRARMRLQVTATPARASVIKGRGSAPTHRSTPHRTGATRALTQSSSQCLKQATSHKTASMQAQKKHRSSAPGQPFHRQSVGCSLPHL